MIYEEIKTGQILPAKVYNQLAINKWQRDWDKAKAEGRDWGCMPQLAFYGFYKSNSGEFRDTGFVCKTPRGSHWFKRKKDANAFRDLQNLSGEITTNFRNYLGK